MRPGYRALIGGLLLAVVSRRSPGQTVRGVVTDGAAPVSGVVVVLVDASAKEAVRAFTNERGEYRLVAPRPGEYRLRTLRIGFLPQVSAPLSLDAGAVVERPLTLSSVPTGLDTLRAVGRNACRLTAADSAEATWRLWEQVRGALTVAQLTRTNRMASATTLSFTKTLEPVRRQVQTQEFNVHSDFASQPWRAATPAELRRIGYVTGTTAGGMTFQAPSIEALLADEFLEDHCLRLTTTRDPSIIGVAFEPNRDRRDIPDIKGTVWVNRASSELRSLEYRYTNADKDVEGFGGGDMEFARLKNGAWAVSSWSIRMPALAMKENARPGEAPTVEAIRVVGGQLVLVTNGDDNKPDTLWSRPPVRLTGVVADSAGTPLRNGSVELAGTPVRANTDNEGRFALALIPGIYTMKVRVAGDTVPVLQSPFRFADTTATVQIRVPRRAVVAASSAVSSAQARGLATLSGTVLDSASKPLPDAEIVLPGIGLSGRSDARGEFVVPGIIPGEHQVIIRRVGYGVLDTRIPFAERQTVERRAVLTRLTVLDSVLTKGSADTDPGMVAFAEHRARGFGTFMDRAQLAKVEGLPMRSVIGQFNGLNVIRGAGSQTWVVGKRGPLTQCIPPGPLAVPPNEQQKNCMRRERRLYVPEDVEMQQGMLIGCYAEVWIDNDQVNRGNPTVPFDLSAINVATIEALEWYEGGSQVPPLYRSPLTSRCGVLVLHTKKFTKKP